LHGDTLADVDVGIACLSSNKASDSVRFPIPRESHNSTADDRCETIVRFGEASVALERYKCFARCLNGRVGKGHLDLQVGSVQSRGVSCSTLADRLELLRGGVVKVGVFGRLDRLDRGSQEVVCPVHL
jgi:hypothetical protein